jgi:hypothetical protein
MSESGLQQPVARTCFNQLGINMSKRITPLPRFRRATSKLRPAFRFQDRDKRIIQIIEEFGIICSDHLKLLAPGSAQNNVRRFQKLFHHGYIYRMERHRLPFNHSIVYTLKNPRTVSDLYLKHTLAISHFRFVLELAIAKTPGASLSLWVPDGMVKEYVAYTSNGRDKGKVIKPDAVFGIKYNNSIYGGFVEIDRSTIAGTTTPAGRLFSRYEAFWHYWRGKQYKKKFGFNSLRIFTVTISKERKVNFRKLVKKVGEQKKGSNLFWFTDMASYDTDPTAIFGPIWQTPRDDTLRQILPDLI